MNLLSKSFFGTGVLRISDKIWSCMSSPGGRKVSGQSRMLTPFRMIEATAAPPHWKMVYKTARSREILLHGAESRLCQAKQE